EKDEQIGGTEPLHQGLLPVGFLGPSVGHCPEWCPSCPGGDGPLERFGPFHGFGFRVPFTSPSHTRFSGRRLASRRGRPVGPGQPQLLWTRPLADAQLAGSRLSRERRSVVRARSPAAKGSVLPSSWRTRPHSVTWSQATVMRTGRPAGELGTPGGR